MKLMVSSFVSLNSRNTEYTERVVTASRCDHNQFDRLNVARRVRVEPVQCDDDCKQLDLVLTACRNVEALETLKAHHIDHVLSEHREYRLNCPFGDCQWRQKSIISTDHKKEIHLHAHFYHDVPIDRDDEDGAEDDEEQDSGYKSMLNNLTESELQFGAPSNALNPREAKSRNLKNELLRNEYCPLDEDLFRQVLRLCVFLTTSRKSKNMGLNVDEIVALKLYLDFRDLRQYLRRCYHDHDPKKRLDFQRTFYHWNQSMKSAINKSREEIGGRLFLPIFDDDVILKGNIASKFVCYGPTAFYADYESASALAAGKATVMEVYAPFSQCGLDVSWLCSVIGARCFLFINTTFQICNVHSPSMDPLNLEVYALNDSLSITDLIKMENDVVSAAHKITNDQQGVLSLNEHLRSGYFRELSVDEIYAVLLLLHLQYRSEIWNQIEQMVTDESVDRRIRMKSIGIMYLRDHFIGFMDKVRSVAMDDMPTKLKSFCSQKQQAKLCNELVSNWQSFDLISELFPRANRVTISGKDFDWSLQSLLQYVKSHDFESKDIVLRHIEIEIDEKNARHRLIENEARDNLMALSKRGWKMVSPNNICYFGSMPEPEEPFLPLFMDCGRKRYESRGRTVSGYEHLIQIAAAEPLEKEHVIKDSDHFDALDQFDDDVIDIEHNENFCTLSSFVFCALDYQQELIELLWQRKEELDGVKRENVAIGMTAGNEKEIEFADRCHLVESLVLDPIPMALQPLFFEDDALSFGITLIMFPNVTDLYLPSTTFDVAICRRFIEFIENQSKLVKLERVYFSNSDRLKEATLVNVQWRLREIGWRFVSSRQMLTVLSQSRWECRECHHQNRVVIIGGEYRSPDETQTVCNLCHFDDEKEQKEMEEDSDEDEAPNKIPKDVIVEFQKIGKSKCRKLTHFDCGQLLYVLDRYAFETLREKERNKLMEHKNAILEYFRSHSIDGKRARSEKKEIARLLSIELCGTKKLTSANSQLLTRLDAIDWNQYDDIPGVKWLPHCAALERIMFLLNHFEQWTADALHKDNQYAVRMSDFVRSLKDYSHHDLQRDIEHVLNTHRPEKLEQSEPCSELGSCCHLRRNQAFDDCVEQMTESNNAFGTNVICDVVDTLIFDRIHCILRHFLMPKKLRHRERTFNLFLNDIRSATSPQYAHGIYMKYSELTPKHKNLYTELTQNEMFSIPKELLDGFMERAQKLMEKNEAVMSWTATRSSATEGIKKGDGMYIEFVLCLLLYCSHTALCTAFRSSFRRLKYDDTEDTIRQRHTDNFYWFGRYLESALIYYGKKARRRQTFLHGLSAPFLFDAFSAVFEIPVSTTDSKATAMSFTDELQGVILFLKPKYKDSNSNSRYLAVSGAGLSPFENEREFLVCFRSFCLYRLLCNLRILLFTDPVRWGYGIRHHEYHHISAEEGESR